MSKLTDIKYEIKCTTCGIFFINLFGVFFVFSVASIYYISYVIFEVLMLFFTIIDPLY